MSTVDKRFADDIIRRDGRYEDDPQITRIIQYDNHWGGVSYGIEYEGQEGKYDASDFIRNPRVYWKFTPTEGSK